MVQSSPMHDSHHKIQFYRHSKTGTILRALTVDDVAFWGADALISVVFALFVVSHIEGASATHVGLAITLRQLMIAFLSIPVGKFLDNHKGHLDEVQFLSMSGILAGLTYVVLGFSTEIWHLFASMAFIGIAHSLNLNAWRILFYGSIKNTERGETTGVYQTIMSVMGALIVGLGGFLADEYGYRAILWIGGFMTFIGGIIPLFLRDLVRKK